MPGRRELVRRIRLDNKFLLQAFVKTQYPHLKHDWFTRHYRVSSNLKRDVYLTFRRLSRKTGLVGVDELALELDIPVKAVISALQDIYDSELSPIVVVSTYLTEYVAGAELSSRELDKLVEELTGSKYWLPLENPLRLMRSYKIDISKAPYYDDLEIDDGDIESIDL